MVDSELQPLAIMICFPIFPSLVDFKVPGPRERCILRGMLSMWPLAYKAMLNLLTRKLSRDTPATHS